MKRNFRRMYLAHASNPETEVIALLSYNQKNVSIRRKSRDVTFSCLEFRFLSAMLSVVRYP